MKVKIEEHETKSKIKITGYLYRGVSEFNKGYQPRTNVAKGDLFTNSYSILFRLRNNYPQLLNILGFNDVKHTEIHTAEPLVPEQSAFEIVVAIEKIKMQKSPDINEIIRELIRVGGSIISSEIHTPIISIWN